MQRQKRKESPDMILQTAVPSTPSVEAETTTPPEEQMTDTRRYVPPVFANGVPKAMLPRNNPARQMELSRSTDDEMSDKQEEEEEGIQKTISNINYNMLFVLAAGIGLGVLLCYKGYEYVTPALKTATNIVDETVTTE